MISLMPLFAVLLVAVVAAASGDTQSLSEQLLLRHLPDGRVLAHFEFTTTWAVHPVHFSGASNGKWSCTQAPDLVSR